MTHTENTTPSADWRKQIWPSIVLGLPLVASHLAQMLIHTTDVLMLGWYGVDELAAVVLATQVFFLVFITLSGVGFAMLPLIATAIGEDDEAGARQYLRNGLWVCAISALGGVGLLAFMEPLLLALGQDPELSDLAAQYMNIAMWSLIPSIVIMGLRSYFLAIEKVNFLLWVTMVGVLVNAITNYVLIFGNFGAPEMGVEGAAIASVTTTVAQLVILVGYAIYAHDLREKQLFVRIWRLDFAKMWGVVVLGIPIGLTILSEAGLFSAATLLMGWLGTIPLATHGIVIQIVSFFFMIPLGLSNVATIKVGKWMGRKNMPALLADAKAVIIISLVVGVVMMVVYITAPEKMTALFLDPDDPIRPEILAYASGLFLVAAAFQVADSLQVSLMGVLRGMKDTQLPLIIAVVCYWGLGLPTAYLLGFYLNWGGMGVWGGLVIGLLGASVLLGWRFQWLLRSEKM